VSICLSSLCGDPYIEVIIVLYFGLSLCGGHSCRDVHKIEFLLPL
jgi:hypothetical protein